MTTDLSPEKVDGLVLLLQKGRFADAAAGALVLREQWPDSANLLAISGFAYSKLKDYESAERDLRRAVEIFPTNTVTKQALGEVLVELGRYEEAEAIFVTIIREPGVFDLLARLYQRAPSLGGFSPERILRIESAKLFEAFPEWKFVATEFVDFRTWVRENHQEVVALIPGGPIEVAEIESGEVLRFDAAPMAAVVVANGQYIGGFDHVLAPTGEILNGSGYMDVRVAYNTFPSFVRSTEDKVLHPVAPGHTDIDEDAFFMSAPTDLHFGHWFIDFLARLYAWKAGGRSAMKVVIPDDLPQHHRETLAQFGVRDADLIECRKGQRYRFRSLTVCDRVDLRRPSAEITRFLRDAFLRDADMAAPANKRVYLQRGSTGRGRIVNNEEELNATIAEFGFQTILRPKISTTEQNQSLNYAEIIASPFGTDLVAIFQVRAGTDVIVFNFTDADEVGIQKDQFALRRLCALLGLRMHVVACEPAEGKTKAAYYRHLVADCDALKACVRKIEARRRAEGQVVP